MAEGREQAAIAFWNEAAAGMVRFQCKKEELYFYRLCVDPNQQGRGIGRELLRWLEEHARREGMSSLACRVRMEIEKNMRLHISAGFTITHRELVEREGTLGIPTATMKKRIT